MSVEQIAEAAENLSPELLIETLLSANGSSSPCLTSSFQAEDMVVLHFLRKRLPSVPVLFLETGYHFAQTYEYRDRMAQDWSLNLVSVLPKQTVAQQESALGILYQSNPTRCCQLRKVDPLLGALEPFDLWFTGLRREQSPTRRNLRKIELHQLPTGKTLWKVSLLADWKWEQVWNYLDANAIPHLPQYDQGYLSIGCEPCTALPTDPSNARSGRWGGTKLECGIHTFSKGAQG